MNPLTAVRRAATEASSAVARRDAKIREAHAAGLTLRAIAAAAGLTYGRIHQIVKQQGE